jgi:hypothetical protein
VGAAHDGPEPPAKRGKSIQGPANLVSVVAEVEPVLLEGVRHTGGMVDRSAV